MAEHKTLKKALRQMAEGSRSGFHTFYLGSSQYIYSSAMLLYDSHEDACRFMVDFYQYLYLHLPEYDQSVNLEKWITLLMIERYEQLSIGKNMSKPSVRQQMNSGTAQLSKSEQERIWHMLDINIRFPKEFVHRSPVIPALVVSALLLLLLVASRYLPALMQHLQESYAASAEAKNTAGEDQNIGNKTAENAEPDSDSQINEPDAIADRLNELMNERTDTNAENLTDDTDSFQQQQQSGFSGTSNETKMPKAPAEPDTPQAPDEPAEPAMSEGTNSLSGAKDLENLELELRYGDSLRF